MKGGSDLLRRRDEYQPEVKEVYVYDQCCGNCMYYCDWDMEKDKIGCKYYDRPDYERKPKSGWCCDWKEKRRRR